MAPIQYPQLSAIPELTVHQELEFVMHVPWGHIQAQGHLFAPLAQQGTHAMTPASPLFLVPLQSTGTMVVR